MIIIPKTMFADIIANKVNDICVTYDNTTKSEIILVGTDDDIYYINNDSQLKQITFIDFDRDELIRHIPSRCPCLQFKSYRNNVYVKYTNRYVNDINNWCTFTSQNIKNKHPGLKDVYKFPRDNQYISDYKITEMENDIYIVMCNILINVNSNDRYEFEHCIEKICSDNDYLYVLSNHVLYRINVY